MIAYTKTTNQSTNDVDISNNGSAYSLQLYGRNSYRLAAVVRYGHFYIALIDITIFSFHLTDHKYYTPVDWV